MKKTVDFEMFAESFAMANRKENFSYCGLKVLFEYLEELEKDIGEEIELDPIGICCKFREYANLAEASGDYGITASELVERTLVIEFEDGIIVKNF